MSICRERRHAHVKGNGKGGAKLWLEQTIAIVSPRRSDERELGQIRGIIRDNLAKMTQKWAEECARVEAEGSVRWSSLRSSAAFGLMTR